MKVKCCGRDVIIEAGDGDGAADAFVAPARESHIWPYPEEAIQP